MSDGIVIQDVIEDVKRVQEFDPNSLVQSDRLGKELAFDSAVRPARRLIDLFKKLPLEAIEEFPAEQLQTLQSHAKSTFNFFDQIIKFNPRAGDPETQQSNLIQKLESSYQQTFNVTYPMISFGVARTVDFTSIEAKGRAAIQAISDDTEAIVKKIGDAANSAENLLKEVRDIAAEQGVTQQAKYFSDEADIHAKMADLWRKYSVRMSVAVASYAVLTLFFPIIPFLSANTTPEAIQLTSSKYL